MFSKHLGVDKKFEYFVKIKGEGVKGKLQVHFEKKQFEH